MKSELDVIFDELERIIDEFLKDDPEEKEVQEGEQEQWEVDTLSYLVGFRDGMKTSTQFVDALESSLLTLIQNINLEIVNVLDT